MSGRGWKWCVSRRVLDGDLGGAYGRSNAILLRRFPLRAELRAKTFLSLWHAWWMLFHDGRSVTPNSSRSLASPPLYKNLGVLEESSRLAPGQGSALVSRYKHVAGG